jgi:hypothetical protein
VKRNPVSNNFFAMNIQLILRCPVRIPYTCNEVTWSYFNHFSHFTHTTVPVSKSLLMGSSVLLIWRGNGTLYVNNFRNPTISILIARLFLGIYGKQVVTDGVYRLQVSFHFQKCFCRVFMHLFLLFIFCLIPYLFMCVGAPSKRHVPSLGVGDPTGIAKVRCPTNIYTIGYLCVAIEFVR